MNLLSTADMTTTFTDQRDAFSVVFNHLLSSNSKETEAFLRTSTRSITGHAIAASPDDGTQSRKLNKESDRADGGRSENSTVKPVMLVSGLLGDSLKNLIAPVMFARAQLVLQGYEIEMAWVNGRSGCDTNARQLREKVLAYSDRHGCPITLVGYSKGCADAMHMLVNHPETQPSVAALVSLAGVVGGTPLAEKVGGFTRSLLDSVPIPGVPRGDGRAIADLESGFRRDWLQTHRLPESVRYASLIAVPEPARISRVLRGGFSALSEISQANDSQVIDCDAILPNSELLAMANADHWAIALPISRRFGRWVKPFVNHNDYPRTVLLQAIIEYLALEPAPAKASPTFAR